MKWRAKINIDGILRNIGIYDDEEVAAVDYARAVFKYRSEEKQAKAKEQRSFIIDLNNVPPQPLILKEGTIKEGTSKYAGIYFDKSRSKWIARIYIDGKKQHIGAYNDEEEAAGYYARAAFKHKNEEKAKPAGKKPSSKRKREESNSEIYSVVDAKGEVIFQEKM